MRPIRSKLYRPMWWRLPIGRSRLRAKPRAKPRLQPRAEPPRVEQKTPEFQPYPGVRSDPFADLAKAELDYGAAQIAAGRDILRSGRGIESSADEQNVRAALENRVGSLGMNADGHLHTTDAWQQPAMSGTTRTMAGSPFDSYTAEAPDSFQSSGAAPSEGPTLPAPDPYLPPGFEGVGMAPGFPDPLHAHLDPLASAPGAPEPGLMQPQGPGPEIMKPPDQFTPGL